MHEMMYSRKYHQKTCVLCGNGYVSVVGAAKYCPFCREKIRPSLMARKAVVVRTPR